MLSASALRRTREARAAPGTPEFEQCSPKWDKRCSKKRVRDEAAADAMSLDMLQNRARFDLQCPEATITMLERHNNGPAPLIGGAGCGRQAMYERRLRSDRSSGGRTTRNTKWEQKRQTRRTCVRASPG